jgi:hypothetical protein
MCGLGSLWGIGCVCYLDYLHVCVTLIVSMHINMHTSPKLALHLHHTAKKNSGAHMRVHVRGKEGTEAGGNSFGTQK